MKHLLKISFVAVTAAILAFRLHAQTSYQPKYELINKAEYPTSDLAVATYNVLDYGADPTGQRDCTRLFQTLLDKLAGVGTLSTERGNYANLTGGILYVPAGKYLFTGKLIVPRGVTLRGDWKKPEPGQPVSGTILIVKPATVGDPEAVENSFITMQPTTEVSNLAFWYPDQDINHVTAYPPTLCYGQQGYWGNDYCNGRHLTFINAYTAIRMNDKNGGGCPNVFDVYGTPLHQGIVMDAIADVGRFDGIHFSGSYWADCGLDGAPSVSSVNNYLYNNAIAMVMRRNDWSYTTNFYVDHYKIGFSAENSPAGISLSGSPNGQNYRFRLNDCQTGINIGAASGAGIMFTDVVTTGGDTGIHLEPNVSGPVSFYGCSIGANGYALLTDDMASSALSFQDCDIRSETRVLGGQLTANANRFYKNVMVWTKARTIFTGNTMENGAKFENNSIFESTVSEAQTTVRPLPVFEDSWMEIKSARPARAALYVVTDPEFGAVPLTVKDDLNSAQDNTKAIQNALDKAKSEGGGIVYIPSGHYRMNGNITIPAGVELKGSGDLATVPKGNGAILECMVGEGEENGTPFITMEQESGIRGITVNYPRQDDPRTVKVYPYTLRGNANVYIVNLALRTAYRGVDLFTNKCDNHYVDYLGGHCFMNVIRVGGNSKNGLISNIQCNTIAYACGDETKFGAWPNSEKMADNKGKLQDYAYGQNKEELDFMIIGDCDGEILYDNFLFGCNKGMIFQNDGGGGATNVHSMGNAVDGAVNTFVFNSLGDDLDLINSQVVALAHNSGQIKYNYIPATFVTMGPDCNRQVTFFSSDHWGSGDYFASVKAGTLNLYLPNLHQSGSVCTFDVSSSSKINMAGGLVSGLKNLVRTVGSMESQIHVASSVIDEVGTTANRFAKWENNLPTAWQLAKGIEIAKYRWSAKASNDENGTQQKARLGIDGSLGTNWNTEAVQTSGQWYQVGFYRDETFNTVILIAPNGQGPADYKVEVSSDATNWTQVKTGKDAGSMAVITFNTVTAKYVRITQMGSKNANWGISEFKIALLKEGQLSGVNYPETAPGDVVYHGQCLYFKGNMVGSSVAVYAVTGVRMLSVPSAPAKMDLSHLSKGQYLVSVRNDQWFSVKQIKIIR